MSCVYHCVEVLRRLNLFWKVCRAFQTFLMVHYQHELWGPRRYKHIAEQYEAKGNLKKAEQYYVEGKLWTSAMGMSARHRGPGFRRGACCFSNTHLPASRTAAA